MARKEPQYSVSEGDLCFITGDDEDDPESHRTTWIEARRMVRGSFEVTHTRGLCVARDPSRVLPHPFAEAAERTIAGLRGGDMLLPR